MDEEHGIRVGAGIRPAAVIVAAPNPITTGIRRRARPFRGVTRDVPVRPIDDRKCNEACNRKVLVAAAQCALLKTKAQKICCSGVAVYPVQYECLIACLQGAKDDIEAGEKAFDKAFAIGKAYCENIIPGRPLPKIEPR